MLAVKGYYHKGKVTLLEPLPEDIQEAELNIVVLPKQGSFPSDETPSAVSEDEAEYGYKALGVRTFFDTDDDANVDWEDCLGLKE
jgi:hypothetical protein